MNSKNFGFFVSFCVICIILNTIVPINCKKGPSKLEILQFLMDAKDHFNIIKKIRDKPILQLIGLVNDVVEPIVTLVDVILLIEEKLKKSENHHQEKDNVLVFSGKNKIEINNLKAPHHYMPLNHHAPNHHLDQYENMIPLESNHIIKSHAFRERPEVFSASSHHIHGYPDENVFKLNFKSHPQQNFHLSRDLPHHFVLLFGKNSQKASFHVLDNPKPLPHY